MAENTPPPGDDEPAFDERGISQVAGPANRNNTLGIIMLGDHCLRFIVLRLVFR